MKEVVSAMPHPHLLSVHTPVLWYVHRFSPTWLPCRRKTAVVLSASLTFLFFLPGLDAFSRATGMVAILFAAFSMAAMVAIFNHKIDLKRLISHVGGGGYDGDYGRQIVFLYLFASKDLIFFFDYRRELLFYLYHWTFRFILS